jgi:cytochrome c5
MFTLIKNLKETLMKMCINRTTIATSLAMPPKGGNPVLTEENIKAVLAYIRAVFGS